MFRKLLIAVVGISLLLTGCSSAPKDWVNAKNIAAEHLKERYPDDKFKFEPPKKSVDTDGSGKKGSDTWYVKTISDKYKTCGIFTCEVTELYDGTYRVDDAYQSVKYGYQLEKKLSDNIDVEHYIHINCYDLVSEYTPVFDTYEDYFDYHTLLDTDIWLVLKEGDLANIKNYVTSIVENLGVTSSGNVRVLVIKKANYKFLNSGDYVEWWKHLTKNAGNLDEVRIPYSNGVAYFDNIDYMREDENSPIRKYL